MFIPFLSKLEAMEILEAEYEGEMARSELEAELGSGFFMDCRDSYQASWMAREQINAMQQDFEQSEEGPLYMSKVEAARFMEGATRGLDLATWDEVMDPRVFTVGPMVPEFFAPNVIISTKPDESDIPF